jgi:hypothetical protein
MTTIIEAQDMLGGEHYVTWSGMSWWSNEENLCQYKSPYQNELGVASSLYQFRKPPNFTELERIRWQRVAKWLAEAIRSAVAIMDHITFTLEDNTNFFSYTEFVPVGNAIMRTFIELPKDMTKWSWSFHARSKTHSLLHEATNLLALMFPKRISYMFDDFDEGLETKERVNLRGMIPIFSHIPALRDCEWGEPLQTDKSLSLLYDGPRSEWSKSLCIPPSRKLQLYH